MPISPEIKSQDDVFWGTPRLTVPLALERLERIERHDPSALVGLETSDKLLLEYFKQHPEAVFSQEWGVAKETGEEGAWDNNAECILISGTKTGVNWSFFLQTNKLVPLAHSHPYHDRDARTTRTIAHGGILWDAINGTNPSQDLEARHKVFPSVGDVVFCATHNLPPHIVKTPYAEAFKGDVRWIVNPDAAPHLAKAPKLSFRIFNARMTDSEEYRATLAATVNGTDIWEKTNVIASTAMMKGGPKGPLRFEDDPPLPAPSSTPT